jgi:hypothetical protein
MSSFVNNTGTNYTLYYNVLDYFKTIMENHPSLASSTQGDLFEIDDKEFQKYPLGNILITSAVFSDSTTIYSCQLTVADKIKLKNNDSEGVYNKQIIRFEGVDDTVDIHANTLAILNDLLSYTQYVPTNFDINGDINCEAFKDRFDNGLGGWVATFDLTTHNDRPRCIFNLLDVPPTTTTTSTTTTTQPTTTSTTTTTQPTTTSTTSTSTSTTSTTTEPTTTSTTSTSTTSTTTEPTTTSTTTSTTSTTTEPTTTSTTTSTTTTTTEPTTTSTTTSTTSTTSTSTTSTTTVAPTVYDVNTLQFLTASGITDVTIGDAVNTLVVGMKSANIWNEMNAVYPFVGGTAETNKWNLKDTGSYMLTASGNWNYSSNGVSSSKAYNDYLDTNLPLTSSIFGGMVDDLSLGIYSRTDGVNGYDFGAWNPSGGDQIQLLAGSTYGTASINYRWGVSAQVPGVVTSDVTSSLGFFQASRTSTTNLVAWVNGYQVGTNTNINPTKAFSNLLIGNIVALGNDPSNRQYAYAYIGNGLNGTQLNAYNTLVQQFQQSLNRKV